MEAGNPYIGSAMEVLAAGLIAVGAVMLIGRSRRPRLSGKDLALDMQSRRRIAAFASKLIKTQQATLGRFDGPVSADAVLVLRNEINRRLLYRAGDVFEPVFHLSRTCGETEYSLAAYLADLYGGKVVVRRNQVIRDGMSAGDIERAGGQLDVHLRIHRPRRVWLSPTPCRIGRISTRCDERIGHTPSKG